jgi:hypothetical protein
MNRLTVFAISCISALAADVVPVPKITPLPVTADSRPLLAASQTLAPMDLSKAGYVEEEFILSGTANVYDWAADGTLTVKTPNAPYASRILVRRPADPARFSGTVVVELMNAARRFDWAMMWSYSHDSFIEHGDAWVGITMPGSVAGLQKFNPTRYAALSFANPAPDAPCATPAKGGPSPIEEGLRWDMMSQVAAALKSNRTMRGLRVERVFMTTQTGDITTYINAIHSHAKLENGKPAYDGYLIKNPPNAGRISQCSAAPAKGEARQTLNGVNVPVIAVVAQGEVLGSIASRRPDSDDPNGRYRLYEIAGAAHIDKYAYDAGFPVFADQIAAVGAAQGTPAFPFNAPCTPEIPLSDHPLLKYSYDAAFANLDQWVRKGTAPPKADRIQVKDAGTPQASLAMDEFGNGLGGVRSPFVDVPVATYTTSSPGPGTCGELGRVVRFDAPKIQSLYGDTKSYASKVSLSVDRMVKERFLTEGDGKRLKAELASGR